MKRLLLIIALCSSTGCISFPKEDELTQLRCDAAPDDPGCSRDAGSTDAGSTDAGSDAGMDAGADGGVDAGFDAGTDAGSDAGADGGSDAGVDAGGGVQLWNLAWQEPLDVSAQFLVGDEGGGTVVATAGSSFSLQSFDSNGRRAASLVGTQATSATAAYEREGLVVLGLTNGETRVWTRQATMYAPATTRNAGFVTTAVDLYPIRDGGFAVAAYGNRDGGLQVDSFAATDGLWSEGSPFVTCSTSVLQPRRILPTPDGGPGVVVGNVTGSCSTPGFAAINVDGGAFVARFGGNIAGDGYSFNAEPDVPMTLGIAQNDLWVAYVVQGGDALELAKVGTAGLLNRIRVLEGTLITPIELLEVGDRIVIVGQAERTISLVDGGSFTDTDDTDVFIAHVNAMTRDVTLQVLVDPGHQGVVGAVYTDSRLVMGGGCLGTEGLCRDAGLTGGWIAGFDLNVQP